LLHLNHLATNFAECPESIPCPKRKNGDGADFVALLGKAEFVRRARLTYPGAFHHAPNCGIRGEYIFPDDGDRKTFMEVLSEKAKILDVEIIRI
jgi:hypothetical protein